MFKSQLYAKLTTSFHLPNSVDQLLTLTGSSNFKGSLKLLFQMETRCSTGQRKEKEILEANDQSLIPGLLFEG